MTEPPPVATAPAQDRPRVAVVFGGTSSEHGVSCLTAAGVLGALDRDRFDAVGIGITRSGRWVVVEDATIARLQVSDGSLPELSEDADDAVLLHGGHLAVRTAAGLTELGRVDVAIALLHGPYGEDGTIQGLFEM
ncbi:MAG: D-alanine--D-alanine ligase, partial [Friedmanniella sp.]|nr:D-alanine--D-alanine ligase [Friedmanniella sp.]